MGILFTVWAVGSIPVLCFALQVFGGTAPQGASPGAIVGWLVSSALTVILHAAIGFLLLFRTDAVADALRIPKAVQPQVSGALEWARIGTGLIGVYAISFGLPQLAKAFLEWRGAGSSVTGYGAGPMFAGLTATIIGVILLNRAGAIARFLSR
jgi:hypothetical protein